MKYLGILEVIIGTFFNIGNIEARIIHVPAEDSTIQLGVDAANSGDTVLVAKGTYSGSINMRNGIYLKSEEGPDSTIISGRLINCYSLTDTVTIDGFSICDVSNQSGANGGGISSYNSNVIIKNNIVRNNYVGAQMIFQAAGGGIYVKGGSVLIENNIIRNNTAEADWRGKYILGQDNGGGGIYAESTIVMIDHNVIYHNRATAGNCCGGGVSCIECLKAVIFNNFIDSNFASGVAGSEGTGIYCTPPVIIVNNTIVNNNKYRSDTVWTEGAAIYCEKASAGQDSIIIRDNIIAFNVADSVMNGTAGIFCSDSLDISKTLIAYNDFYLNTWNNFYNTPAGIGIFSWGSNRRSISCDSFYNINIDPGFVKGPEGNYYQKNVIDCGDYIVDDEFRGKGGNTQDGKPDTGWVDLGYHYGVPAGIEENEKLKEKSEKLKIGQNPFNKSTNIYYEMPMKSKVSLKLYDLSGREVRTLAEGEKQEGKYEVKLSSEGLRTEVYFIKLEAGTYKETKKVVLVK